MRPWHLPLGLSWWSIFHLKSTELVIRGTCLGFSCRFRMESPPPNHEVTGVVYRRAASFAWPWRPGAFSGVPPFPAAVPGRLSGRTLGASGMRGTRTSPFPGFGWAHTCRAGGLCMGPAAADEQAGLAPEAGVRAGAGWQRWEGHLLTAVALHGANPAVSVLRSCVAPRSTALSGLGVASAQPLVETSTRHRALLGRRSRS